MALPKRCTASYSRVFPQTLIAAREARFAVVTFARTFGFSGQCLNDIEIAVGEALANAVEHGYGDRRSFAVHVRGDAHVLAIDIVDCGRGFDYAAGDPQCQPPSDALRGFGRFIMHELMDRVEYCERGTRLQLMKRLPARPAEASLLEA